MVILVIQCWLSSSLYDKDDACHCDNRGFEPFTMLDCKDKKMMIVIKVIVIEIVVAVS